MKKNNITVAIYSYNEEENIHDCINSAKLLTENIILIDLQSTDYTAEIAKKNGATVHFHPHVEYVEPVREFGIGKTDTDWVFILDADERVTKELAYEIKLRLHPQGGHMFGDNAHPEGEQNLQTRMTTHYKIPRKNIFAGIKWLKHGGWWPDYQIRLINKKYFKSWPKKIHSSPEIDGNFAFLHNPIIHYFHGDLELMLKKTITFENIEADLLLKAGKQVKTCTFFRKFLGELFRRLIKNSGFLDGEIGIIESIYQAFSKTITYLFLYEKKHQNKKGSSL